MRSWWALTTGVVAACIGAAFLTGWILDYALGVFNIANPQIPFSWLALTLAGLAWGLVYVLAGTANADNGV